MTTVAWNDLSEDENGFVTLRGHPFTGIAEEKYANGCLRAQNEYLNGVQHGLQRWWHNNGELSEEATTRSQQYHGCRRVWFPNGSPKTEELWEYGILLAMKEWDEGGTVVEDTRISISLEQSEYLQRAREDRPLQ